MQFRFIFLMSTFFFCRSLSAQEVYNNCLSALEICPSQTYSVNNLGANAITCAGCEDAFAFCFAPQNSIWLRFLTNATGGNIQVDFTNLAFESNVGQDNELQATIVQATSPCDGSTYSALGNCVSNASGNFTLNALGLLPSTTYYIVIDGDNTGIGVTSPAECTFDAAISGTGIDRPAPTVSISAPLTPLCLFETATWYICSNHNDAGFSNFCARTRRCSFGSNVLLFALRSNNEWHEPTTHRSVFSN
jgi:hypothetical protein